MGGRGQGQETKKSPIIRFLYVARDLHSRNLFASLERHVRGNVLDVGGWDFYEPARKRQLHFHTWTTLEYAESKAAQAVDRAHNFVVGDGCRMPFRDGRYDTVLNIQVLEHVFEPIQMVGEVARVLRPGGCCILLIPQTGTIHSVPNIYSNFTRFWVGEVMERTGLEIVELEPLGGTWSSMASRLFYFFLQSARVEGFSTPECRRNAWFYLLFPLMVLYALVSIPICLLFGLGDLAEEPNNHLVVVRKPL